MGWSRGSQLMDEVIEAVEDNSDDRVALFTELIKIFEDYDCDTLGECLGQSPNFDEAYQRMYPEDDLDTELEEDRKWLEHREETWVGNFEEDDGYAD